MTKPLAEIWHWIKVGLILTAVLAVIGFAVVAPFLPGSKPITFTAAEKEEIKLEAQAERIVAQMDAETVLAACVAFETYKVDIPDVCYVSTGWFTRALANKNGIANNLMKAKYADVE